MAQQTLIENIDQYLMDGMPVYDSSKDKIGDVKMYSATAGYMLVEYGLMPRKNLYIPFRLISTIDPKEIFLTESKDKLVAKYIQPPKISTVSEERLTTGKHGSLVAQRRDVQLVESGYDDRTATINSVDTQRVGSSLAIGMAVYDAMQTRIGDLTQYDTTRNLMTVEKGLVRPRTLVVPFSAVDRVDKDNFSVYLTLPGDVVVKEHTMLFENA
jgi:hypothetical protein